MSPSELDITGYRAIRSIRFPLKRLTWIEGLSTIGIFPEE